MGPWSASSLQQLCEDCLAALGVDAVAVSLFDRNGAVVSRAVAGSIEESVPAVGALLGEGPERDAWVNGAPEHVATVAALGDRRPGLAAALAQAGVGAIDAFPLQVGAARFGVMTLYRARPGPLSDALLVMALATADALTGALLDLQAEATAATLPRPLEDGMLVQAVVHQATGVTAERCGCSVDEALVRLRAMAFAAGRPLVEVAADVVSGRMEVQME